MEQATATSAGVPASALVSGVAVGLLVLLTVALRVIGLPGGGPVAYDEGWAMANGRYLVSLLLHPETWGPVLHRDTHVFLFGTDWKAGHDMTLGSLMAAGISPENLTWYSALAGIVMVLVLTAVAWKRWGPPAAAAAGVFAGTLPLGIVYGHRIVAEAAGLAGVAIILYLVHRWWTARPSKGLVVLTIIVLLGTLGLSYRFYPTLIPIVALFVWLALWYRKHEQPPRARAGRIVLLCLVPTAAIVAAYLLIAAAHGLGLPGLPARIQDQFVRSSSSAPLPFADPGFYLRTFLEFAGLVFIVPVTIGLLVLASRWRQLEALDAVALGSLVGTLLFFSAVHDKAPRAIVICLPFAALIVARAIALLDWKGVQWLVAAPLCCAFLVAGWAGSNAAISLSGSGQAGRWLSAHPGTIVASRAPIFAAYTEHAWDPAIGLDPAHLYLAPRAGATVASLRGDGARWVVVDAHTLLNRGEASVFGQLIACGRPAVAFDDPAGWSRLQFVEEADTVHLGYDGVLAARDRILAMSQGQQVIRIYDLQGPGTAQCE